MFFTQVSENKAQTSSLMSKPVLICGRHLSRRAARMLAEIADQKGVFHTANPGHEWSLLTEEHIRSLAEQMSREDLRCYHRVGEKIAGEIEGLFSNFGLLLRSNLPSGTTPRRFRHRWTREQPTIAGWYWWCGNPYTEPTIYRVGERAVLPTFGWWTGPLRPPTFDASPQ